MFTGPIYKLFFLSLRSFNMFTGPLFQINTHLLSTVLLSGFQSSPGVWNPLSKAVPGKFHGSGGHSNCNCLQDRANFHWSHRWLIFQLFNTGTCNTLTRDHFLQAPSIMRRRYNVTSSLIGQAHTQNDPCTLLSFIVLCCFRTLYFRISSLALR